MVLDVLEGLCETPQRLPVNMLFFRYVSIDFGSSGQTVFQFPPKPCSTIVCFNESFLHSKRCDN